MLCLDSRRELFYQYAALYRPYINQVNKRLAPFQLTFAHWAILYRLYYHGKHTVSEISQKQHVEKPTITKMVQKLVELELVEAKEGEDKRVRNLQLTNKGAETFETVQRKIIELQQTLVEGISLEDQWTTIRVLQKISEKLISE